MGVKSRKKQNPSNISKHNKEHDKSDNLSTKGPFLQKFCCYMFEQEDASYLAVFRIMWGLVMMLEIFEHMTNDFAKTRSSFYQNPEFTYKYWALEWCTVPDLNTMKLFMIIMFILATFVTIGFLYRLTSILFACGFVYIFALEAALYLNHFYLVIIMAFMLCFLPCNVYFSVDAKIFPSIASSTVPKWCLWVIRAELFIVYTYAGVAKMNLDWIRSEPLRHWLLKRVRYPLIGWLFQYEPVVYWFSWSGLMYDLIVGTLLIVPQTFYIGLFSTLFFHGFNKYIFHIGIFPWLMIASTFLFFEPYWPRRLIHWFKEYSKRKPQPFRNYKNPTWAKTKVRKLKLKEILILLLCLCFLSQQILTPLRYYTYPGNVFWNEHGHRYSWRMKLRDKQCDAELYVYFPHNQEWFEFPLNNILTPRQYGKFTSRPEFILQATRFVEKKLYEETNSTIELYVYCACRVNYREATMFTNPRINLAGKEVWEWPYDWVTEMPPLNEEQLNELPWNWEWNFNWLLKPWESNYKRLKEEQEENINKMNELISTWPSDYAAWITETKFNGNFTAAKAKYRTFINEEHKRLTRENALRGLLIR